MVTSGTFPGEQGEKGEGPEDCLVESLLPGSCQLPEQPQDQYIPDRVLLLFLKNINRTN